jgi:hypothetical protein
MGRCCWPWSHEWTKWEPRVGRFVDYGFAWQRNVKPRDVTEHWQTRTCQRCGKLQQERLEFPERKTAAPRFDGGDAKCRS